MVDWLQISQVSGNSGVYTVTVTASSTSELTARTTSLTVTAHAPAGGIWTDKTQTVSIRQRGLGELVVTPTVLNFVASGGSATIEITTYIGNWTITGSDWLSFSQTTGGTGQTTVTVTAPNYSGDRRRIGSISITDGESTVNVNVNQWGIFSVVPNSFTFPESGGVESFTVTSSRDWSITNIPAWITMSQVSGYNGTYTVTMTADTNTGAVRTGSFTVSDGYSTVNCSISQAAPYTPTNQYLTFNILSSGTINWKYFKDEIDTPVVSALTIEYSINDGPWNSITATEGRITGGTSFNVTAGDVVKFRGQNARYGSPPKNNYYDIGESNTFDGSTAYFDVEGNIMSLIDYQTLPTGMTTSATFMGLFMGTNVQSAANLELPLNTTEYCYFKMFGMGGANAYVHCKIVTPPVLRATVMSKYCYADMFSNCDSMTSVPALPATTLAEDCYGLMFVSCSGLTTVPNNLLPATSLANRCYAGMFEMCYSLSNTPTLPATTMASYCYTGMFWACRSLTTLPSLPATTLAKGCYDEMFRGCTGITTIPSNYLPVTSLYEECYDGMFLECTSMTTVPSDLLPSTTLAKNCYYYMFAGCTSLTTAPDLPATTLKSGCYQYMFKDSTSLNYIKCLATDISASNCTKGWVNNVAATGTFVKNSSMSGWSAGIDGIPSGWTVQNA